MAISKRRFIRGGSGGWPLAGDLGVNFDRLAQMRAFFLLRHVAVVDPLQAVARDFPLRLLHRGSDLGIALQGGRDREYRHRHVALGEHAPQPPIAGARAILEHGFEIHMPFAGPGLSAEYIG